MGLSSHTVSRGQCVPPPPRSEADEEAPISPTAPRPTENFADTAGFSETAMAVSPGASAAFDDSMAHSLPKVLGTSTLTGVSPGSPTLDSNPLDGSSPHAMHEHNAGHVAFSDSNVSSNKDPRSLQRTSFVVDDTDALVDKPTKIGTSRRVRRRLQKTPRVLRVTLAVLCVLCLVFGVYTLVEACIALGSIDRIPTSIDSNVATATYRRRYKALMFDFFIPVIVVVAISVFTTALLLTLVVFAPHRVIMSDYDNCAAPLFLCIATLFFAVYDVYVSVVFSYDLVLYQRQPLLPIAIVNVIVHFALFFFFLVYPCTL